MAWWYAVVESRHELQNPTSAEKLRLLGERLGLTPESRVLDVGAGRAGPAILLAREFGCRIRCVERSPEFARAARERLAAAGVGPLVDILEADGATADLGSGYDAALCLGASFIWGGLAATLRALAATVCPRGFVAVGEPYWRRSLLSDVEPEDHQEFATLPETVERAGACGLEVLTLIDSSLDDWDRYESLHWLTLEEWLAANPEDPQAEEFRERGRRERERYLEWQRDLLGWAILVCRT
jgi:SAM-dependent methyltransferase